MATDATARRWLRPLLAVGLMVLAAGASAGAAWLLRGASAGRGASGETDPIKRGRVVYGVYCVSCHGAEGRGDGPAAAELRPPPRDFAAGAWKCGTESAAVRRVVAGGQRDTAMPGFGSALSAGDLDAVTAYVLTLAPAAAPRERLPAETRQLLQRAGLSPADPPAAAPALGLRDAAGKSLTLSDLRGRVVLVQFWETTCAPCLAKLAHLEAVAEEYRRRGLDVLPVCLDEKDGGRLATVAARHVKGLPVYLDARGTARAHYDVSALPAACLIDREGRLVGKGAGPEDWSGPEGRALLEACLDSNR
jgi:mono/diheme cytochrome c family protein/peroxiredoxin